MKKNDSDTKREILQALALLTQLGASMAACIFVGVLGGRFLDRLLGTGPWLLLVGVLLGVGAAFKTMYDLTIRRYR